MPLPGVICVARARPTYRRVLETHEVEFKCRARACCHISKHSKPHPGTNVDYILTFQVVADWAATYRYPPPSINLADQDKIPEPDWWLGSRPF